MSVDFGNNSKTSSNATYPIDAYGDSDTFSRCEPLITPQVLREDWLFAIPLTDKATNSKITDETLKRAIQRAIGDLELSLKINIAPMARKTKLPFDYNLYIRNGYLECPWKPISRIISLSIEDASFNTMYEFPAGVIETNKLYQGLITFGPVTTATSNGQSLNLANGGNGVLLLLQQMWQQSIAQFYMLDCVTGFPEDRMPSPINELIGIMAAIDIIGRIYPLFRNGSQSLSHDGISQSTSTQMVQIIGLRLTELKEKREKLLKQIKGLYYNSIMVSNI